METNIRMVIFPILGAVIGFGIGYFTIAVWLCAECAEIACFIMKCSSAIRGAMFGAFIGLIFAIMASKKSQS